jgi:anti-sigma regulatory factor (Ser/Thr protein kinase)/biotin operon repressor
MANGRQRGEEIRQFILASVDKHPKDVVALTAQHFGITRQAVHKHIQRLLEQQAIQVKGLTKNKSYYLQPLLQWRQMYALANQLEEDRIWSADIKPLITDLPTNAQAIWLYGFTEIFNNAIDHAGCQYISVEVQKTALYTEIRIIDDGEGIFRKIQRALNLHDQRHAVLELAKGKLTTDPAHHTGEGIFFSSRMFDQFAILSGDVYFFHEFNQPGDWILDGHKLLEMGTHVFMRLNNNTARTSKQVFLDFAPGDDFAFTKTVVPVRLAQYGDDNLVSRSQAKRLLARVDRFKVVIFDFAGVEMIGQAFADEIFRVFQQKHPAIEMMSTNTCPEVAKMIRRAESV